MARGWSATVRAVDSAAAILSCRAEALDFVALAARRAAVRGMPGLYWRTSAASPRTRVRAPLFRPRRAFTLLPLALQEAKAHAAFSHEYKLGLYSRIDPIPRQLDSQAAHKWDLLFAGTAGVWRSYLCLKTAGEMPTPLLLFTSLTLRLAERALSWVRFDAPPPTNAANTAQRYPLYPLRATYMPCGSVELRNTEPRNVRMCKETEYFVASLLNADGASCAAVGTLLRIDGVENATRDSTGQVLARPRDAPRALRVRCTAVGRRRLVGIRNGDAYFDAGARLRGEFLVGEFEAYDDDESTDTTPDAASALAFLARSLQGDERKVVEEAATLATAETSWEALELWRARRASPPRPPTLARTATNCSSTRRCAEAEPSPCPSTLRRCPRTTAGGSSRTTSARRTR